MVPCVLLTLAAPLARFYRRSLYFDMSLEEKKKKENEAEREEDWLIREYKKTALQEEAFRAYRPPAARGEGTTKYGGLEDFFGNSRRAAAKNLRMRRKVQDRRVPTARFRLSRQ